MEGLNTNLLGSSAILAVLGVAAFSAYVSGPLIVNRMSQKMNWLEDCVTKIEREIKIDAPPPPVRLGLTCDDVLDSTSKDFKDFATFFGLDKLCKSAEARARFEDFSAQEKLSAKMGSAPSRCQCAVSHTIGEKRIAVALHAASARLVVPLPIQNLKSEFTASLNSPVCASIAKLGTDIGG